MWNILIWGTHISQNLEFLFLPFPDPNLFLPLFSPSFSVLLLLLPFAFHILSGYYKKVGVN